MGAQIAEIAERIKELREILGLSYADMAGELGISEEEYASYESGDRDFSYTFLSKCAIIFHVDIIELITGDNPKLASYTITRKGKGLPIDRRKGFIYRHLAPLFKDKIAEVFLVTAPYDPNEENLPIPLNHHEGQEFDYILSGSLKVVIGDNVEILNEGDAIYYESGNNHGMIATGGEDCVLLAAIMKRPEKLKEC